MTTSHRDRALDAFLSLVGERGYAAVTLCDVAEAAGLGLAELYRLYPDKPAMVAGLLARIDADVLAGVPRHRDPEETARDRLFDVLMRRYDSLKPHRDAWRSLRAAALRDPVLALSLASSVRRSMAAALEAAGLSSDGLTGALRQNGLLAIHYVVSGTFDRDQTSDLSPTMAALDSRLKGAEKLAQLIERYGSSRAA